MSNGRLTAPLLAFMLVVSAVAIAAPVSGSSTPTGGPTAGMADPLPGGNVSVPGGSGDLPDWGDVFPGAPDDGLPGGDLPGGSLPGGSLPGGSNGEAAVDAPGEFEQVNYNGRVYYKYVPQSVEGDEDVPLVVVLHGCSQDVTSFAAQTGYNQVAEEEGLVVVYPQQTKSQNTLRCWRWFQPRSQQRGSGDAGLIADMTNHAMSNHRIDDQRVYLAGFSAGGGLVPAMAAAYPDLYAAVGILSGLEYKAATGQGEAWTVMTNGGPDPQRQGEKAYDAMGSRANVVPTIVTHGESDDTVSVINGRQATEQATQTMDLAANGKDDDSVPSEPDTQTQESANGLTYTKSVYEDSYGNPVVTSYVVDGMGHGWPGAAQNGEYANPDGPKGAQITWEFFEQYTVDDDWRSEPNEDPTASASADDTDATVGESVSFDASASTDPDGQITAYQWSFGDGTTATGASVSHSFDSPGSYEVELTVEDDAGATDTDTVTVEVEAEPPENAPPTADASADADSVDVGETVSFDASDSTDVDGEITEYLWAFDDGTTATGASVSHSFDSPGSYDVVLTVTDDDGATATDSVTIEVADVSTPNAPPTADASADDTDVTVGESVAFDATGSSDSDGQITQYTWVFGDGSTATGESVSHTFEAPGSYDVALAVTDDDGATATATVTVDVEAEPEENEPPTVEARASETEVDPGEKVMFYTTETVDPDGAVADLEWDLPNGTSEGPVAIETFEEPGTYTVELSATDDDGATATDTVEVTVRDNQGACHSAYNYKHALKHRAEFDLGSFEYVAVGSGDSLGGALEQTALAETDPGHFERVDSCDGSGGSTDASLATGSFLGSVGFVLAAPL